MAGVAGLLATCAAVAASAAHLLPLLLLLICPRGSQAEQGKRSFVRFLPAFLTLPTYLRRANQAPDDSPRRHLGSRCIAPIAALGCILSQMYRPGGIDRRSWLPPRDRDRVLSREKREPSFVRCRLTKSKCCSRIKHPYKSRQT